MAMIYNQGRLHGQAIIDARDASIRRMAPEVWNGHVGHALYIGAKPGRHHYLDRFQAPVILEAFETNADGMRREGYHVLHGDVRDWKGQQRVFDVVFWWHGPEHLTEDELDDVLPKLEQSTSTMVLGCPWGVYEQGAVGDNQYEIHLSHLDAGFFESRGYDVECLGMKDTRGSHMTAVKRRS